MTFTKLKIRQIGKVTGGGTPRSDNPLYFGGDIPWITPRDLSGYESVYIERGSRNITQLGLKKSSAEILPVGTVLFSSRAPIGYIVIAKNEMATNQGFKSIICNPEIINNEYLYYYLKLHKREVESIASGSTFKEISGSVLGDFEVEIHKSVSEQQKIAAVLGVLDDKIELNRKMNKTLESLGQAIFKQWFLDDKKMPESWEIVTAEKELKITYGKNLPTNELIDSGYPVYGGNGIIGFHSKYLYSEPQMIIACRGAACGALHKTKPNSFVTNNSLVFEIPESSPFNIYFLEYYLKSIDRTEFVTGSAQPQITVSNLNHIEILKPDKKMLDQFQKIMKPIADKIYLNEQEIATLSQIRDSLLPRLMSGKLRVK